MASQANAQDREKLAGEYDLVLVGSGNGACAFLASYQRAQRRLPATQRGRVLVLESGQPFFEVSDVTSQRNWWRSYGEAPIITPHNAMTPAGQPILTVHAVAQGGGGSINFSMIHESPNWLATHLGYTEEYWARMQQELNSTFDLEQLN